MDDLHINSKLATVVVQDDDADGAAAGLEGLVETVPEVGLVDDWEGLLDVASLSHSHNVTIMKIQDTVLLENRAQHSLNNHTWGWAANEAALLMQLLGEQVNTQEAVLAGSLRGGDLDDLAWTALENHNVANADVVGWDRDRVGDAGWAGRAARAGAGGRRRDVDVDLRALGAVDYAVGGAVETGAERVVVTILIIVTHLVVNDNL